MIYGVQTDDLFMADLDVEIAPVQLLGTLALIYSASVSIECTRGLIRLEKRKEPITNL